MPRLENSEKKIREILILKYLVMCFPGRVGIISGVFPELWRLVRNRMGPIFDTASHSKNILVVNFEIFPLGGGVEPGPQGEAKMWCRDSKRAKKSEKHEF